MEAQQLAWKKAQAKAQQSEEAEITSAVNEPDFVDASREYHRANQALLVAEEAYQTAYEARRSAFNRLVEAQQAALADNKEHDSFARIMANRSKEAPSVVSTPDPVSEALPGE
jgi:hypothetical protein